MIKFKRKKQTKHTRHAWEIQYIFNLVILDENVEVHHSLSNRNGDVASLWTQILNGRVWTIRDLCYWRHKSQ